MTEVRLEVWLLAWQGKSKAVGRPGFLEGFVRAEANEQSGSTHLLSARGRRRSYRKKVLIGVMAVARRAARVVPGDTARDLIIVAKYSHHCIPGT